MKVCHQCGTAAALAPMVPVVAGYALETLGLFVECADEFDCFRRRQMRMGPLPDRPEGMPLVRPIWLTFEIGNEK